jgi:ABC-type molybdenum transport system ATPase subunit/photorepair protein PhrA
MQACQQVGLEPYLAHLEDGIFTRLQSEGAPLSATAAKRVILARSMVHQPGLMIYEDVFTALTLDEKAELYNTLTGLPWTLVAFSNDPLLQQACDLRYELSNRQITKLP